MKISSQLKRVLRKLEYKIPPTNVLLLFHFQKVPCVMVLIIWFIRVKLVSFRFTHFLEKTKETQARRVIT